jgi:hypothetical protein
VFVLAHPIIVGAHAVIVLLMLIWQHQHQQRSPAESVLHGGGLIPILGVGFGIIPIILGAQNRPSNFSSPVVASLEENPFIYSPPALPVPAV